MKCIINDKGIIKRVKDKTASKMVATGQWSYCPKAMWKEDRKTKKKKEMEN